MRTDASDAVPRRVLLGSVAFLTLVVGLALLPLAVQGDTPKVLRVAVAFVAYIGTLLILWRQQHTRGSGAAGYRPFASAGAVAGLLNAIVRPVALPMPAFLVSVLGAMLLGGVHWLGVRAWHRSITRRGRGASRR